MSIFAKARSLNKDLIIENLGNKNKINTIGSSNELSKIKIKGNNNNFSFLHCNIANMNIEVNEGNANCIRAINTRLNNAKITINGSNNSIIFNNKSSVLNLNIFMRGNNHRLEFHDGVDVYGSISFWFEDHDNGVIIGKYTTIGSANISVADLNTKIILGDHCMLANNVRIINSDFHSIIDLETNKRINQSTEINIKEHVWLGENTNILKNVTIEENSIVALGSVVVKNVPANCVVAGNPAKVIKENIKWIRERI